MDRDELNQYLETCRLRADLDGENFGVILFSIDHFRLINGRFGHACADELLERVFDLASATVGRSARLGRWAGDEFLCILPDADLSRALRLAEDLRQLLAHTAFPIDGSIMNITASFGIATYPADGAELRLLMASADEALTHAKRSGRNRVSASSAVGRNVFRTANLLDAALREDRVMPAYQPIVDLASGRVVAEEALARIVTAKGEIVGADEFIAIATQFQLVHKIDRTVLLCALDRQQQCMAARQTRLHFVNVSGDLLRQPAVFGEILDSARRTHNGHDNGDCALVLEVTERELLGDPAAARRLLAPFMDLGLRLALDDFGSGYSSFQYLADLPVSYLKIDGELIRRLNEPKVRGIVRGIQNTAGELGLVTLAEYVEHDWQVEALRDIGVNWGQGHLYGEATVNEVEAARRRRMSVNWAQGYYYNKSQG